MHCPIEINQYETITIAHGGGGKLTESLIDKVFLSEFTDNLSEYKNDSATVNITTDKIAVTTDSYVIKPVFFPGGNIGKLAVCGTINDLLMSGAKPKYLTCGFIIEEGFKISALRRIVKSMAQIAKDNNIAIIAGDTKVIERSHSEPNLYINTTGIGEIINSISPAKIQLGDAIIVSGDIGKHGIAVMSAREGLEFDTVINSDCASLSPVVCDLINKFGSEIHCMRDLTRGGLATICIELAEQSGFDFELSSAKIPIERTVHAACEMLGLDPLFCANEGRCVCITSAASANEVVSTINRYSSMYGSLPAEIIGKVIAKESSATVKLVTEYGSSYRLSKQTGEQLPRIC